MADGSSYDDSGGTALPAPETAVFGAVDRLARLWAARAPVVIELSVDPAIFREAETTTKAPYEHYARRLEEEGSVRWRKQPEGVGTVDCTGFQQPVYGGFECHLDVGSDSPPAEQPGPGLSESGYFAWSSIAE